MNILITWWSGMLWSTFHQEQTLEQQWHTVYYTDRDTLDICDSGQIGDFFSTHQIDYCINCAAYTNVEQAEQDIRNYDINTVAVMNLAYQCEKSSVKLVHISTDYVFDGSKKEWYLTDDHVWPLNEYGKAKRLWEQAVFSLSSQGKVIRTSWLYGGGKEFKNFVHTMLTLAETKSELSIVSDQWWSPTYTSDIVRAISELIASRDNQHDTIFHFCNTTVKWWITRYDFAKEIFDYCHSPVILYPVWSDAYLTQAKRPCYSWLINDSSIQLPNRKESLHKYLNLY